MRMQSAVLLALSLAGGAIVSTAIPASAQQATPESAQPATPEPAQEAITTSTQQSAVPTVIPVSGEFRTSAGEPRSGAVALIISLYDNQDDTAPRWLEVEPATLDAAGRYNVQFGASRLGGLPPELFTGAGGTRWLGVAIQGELEQPRVPLISVPYAARAVSADTLAGKAVTEFVQTSTLRDDLRAALQEGDGTPRAVAGGLNFLQKGDGAAGTVDSAVFETSAFVGINTTTPGDRLHVVGGGIRSTDNGTTTFVRSHPSINGSEVGTLSASPFWFITSGFERMRIDAAGNVGIGTNNPVNGKLEVVQTAAGQKGLYIGLPVNAANTAPAIRVQGYSPSVELLDKDNQQNWYFGVDDNDLNKFKIGRGYGPNQGLYAVAIDSGDNVTFRANVTTLGNIAAKYQDVAEWVDGAEPLEAGSLVVIDSTATNRVKASRTAYDRAVAGAVSAQPGVVLGESGPGKVLVAQSGRVRIKVDASYGAVKPGDLLVSSRTKGHAMRAPAGKVRPGTLIGKALEALPSGRGEILALLTLQ
jgi:hypothetical protein